MSARKGATLPELIVSSAIFMFLSTALLVIMNVGVKSWTVIERKTVAESGLNRLSSSIIQTVSNSSAGSLFSAYNEDSGDGRLLCLASLRTEGGSLLNDELSYDAESGVILWNFQVVFFTAKLKECRECRSIWGGDQRYCPHRMVVRRLYAVEPTSLKITPWSDVLSRFLDDDGEAAPCSGPDLYSSEPYDKVLAHNIIAFRPSVSKGVVRFSVKALKTTSERFIYPNSAVGESIRFLLKAPVKEASGFYGPDGTEPLGSNVLQIGGASAPLNE